MWRFAGRKLVAILPVITLLVFLMRVLVPGDPVEVMFMGQATDRATIERVRRELGWDRPILLQYAEYVGQLARGDLGKFHPERPAGGRGPPGPLSADPDPLASLALAVTLGLALGIVAALQRERWLDAVATAGAVVGISMPPFWLGLLLIGLVSVRWGLLPVIGAESWRHLILPAFTLGVVSAAAIARLVRSSLLETLGQDFVRTARAKGLPAYRVVTRHALRAALGPVLSVIGLQFGFMLSGAFLVEVVFAWHGVGELAGALLTSSRVYLARAPWLVNFPGLAILVTVLGLNLLGNALRDVLDPRLK